MKTAVFVLAVYGAAISLSLLKVGEPFRWAMSCLDFKLFRKEEGSTLKLFSQCPACLSFWISLAATFWHAPLGPWIWDRVAVSVAMVGLVWIVHVTLSKLGQYEL